MKKGIIILIFILVCFSAFSLSIDDFKKSTHAGTRKDPIPTLDGYSTVTIHDMWTDKAIAEVDVAISGVIRGTQANLIVKNFNMFNSDPETNKEYALVYVYVRNNKDLTGNDDPVKIDYSNFYVVDKDFNRTRITSIVSMDEQLDAEIYEDGKAEGFIVCQVKPNEIFYLQIEGVWFKLNSVSDPFDQL
ncbi:MAG TPA: hypothetical protein DCP98_03740 [Sphaerochaeta sp.]|jgi:hypothetical protein|nr:hypothetical protein [Sphaerochaeta sp.]